MSRLGRKKKQLREKQLKEKRLGSIVKRLRRKKKQLREKQIKEQQEKERQLREQQEKERQLREQQEKEEKLRRQQEYDSLLNRLRERREELLRTQQELGEKELRAKQLKEAQSKKIVEDEIIDMFLKNVDKSIDKREEEIREARERQEKERQLREQKEYELRKKQIESAKKRLEQIVEQIEKEAELSRRKYESRFGQLRGQKEKELLSQTPTKQLTVEDLSEPDISPIKQTDASKEDIKEPEFQTQTPSPSTSKKIVEEILEIQAKESSAKERFDRLSAIASLRADSSIAPYVGYTPTKQARENVDYFLSKIDKEKYALAGKIFNISEDERGDLIKLFENFKEKNKTAADQMNFILINHRALEANLVTFFEFAANYTIHTGIPILNLENEEIYDELKEDTDYTQEACNYVAKILSKIKSIINAAKKADIKIRNVPKTQITKVIQETIGKLKTITETREKEYFIYIPKNNK